MADIISNDQIVKRKEKKVLSEKFSEFTKKVDISMTDKTKIRIDDCGTFLEFLTDNNFENYKLNSGNFCGNRFCPHCSFNKSQKDALMLNTIIKAIHDKFGYNFLMLTLTAPNVKSFELEEELKSFYNANRKLFQRKQVKAINLGYIRKFEITYNKNNDTYHPHYHLLLVVKKSYFDSRYYISRNLWLDMWKSCKKDNSITQVDIRKLNTDNISKSVLELTKYVAKDTDYLINERVFKVFYDNLKGKRYLSFNGIFKKYRDLYKAGLLDSYIEKDDVTYIYKLFYVWKKSNYNLKEVFKMSDYEIEKVNLK